MTTYNDQQIDSYAEILWGYLRLNQPLEKSDAILVFGGHDKNVATYSAKLFLEQWAGLVVISGGVLHSELYGNKPPMIEALALKEIMENNSVPSELILVEDRAKNTSENFWFTEELLTSAKLNLSRFLIVVKPYTERRTYATALKRWPNAKVIVTSETIEYKKYISRSIPREKIINMMVGEIKRIKEYPEIGYSIPQTISSDVWDAYLNLQKAGYIQRT